jgi:hypothetical protein
MTTPFYSTKTATGSGVQPRTNLALCSVSGTYTMLAAFLDEDVVNLVTVPAGATVLEVILDVPALTDQADVTWDLGDATVTGRFILAGTEGRSSLGAIVRLSVVGSSQYAYTADTKIQFKIKTVPGATAVTNGTIKLTVIYTMDL